MLGSSNVNDDDVLGYETPPKKSELVENLNLSNTNWKIPFDDNSMNDVLDNNVFVVHSPANDKWTVEPNNISTLHKPNASVKQTIS